MIIVNAFHPRILYIDVRASPGLNVNILMYVNIFVFCSLKKIEKGFKLSFLSYLH